MSYEKEIESLESEWSEADGFFGQLRQGRFVLGALERALAKVRMISIDEAMIAPRRMVSLLWSIPLFMHWQEGRVRESAGDVAAYERATTMMTTEIERLLGVPCPAGRAT